MKQNIEVTDIAQFFLLSYFLTVQYVIPCSIFLLLFFLVFYLVNVHIVLYDEIIADTTLNTKRKF